MATKPVPLLLYCCYLLLASGISAVSGVTPVTYHAKTSSECSQSDPLQDEQLMEALRQIEQQLGPPGCNPPRNRSCQEVLHCFPSAPSGYYQIHAANGSAVQVYCDMEGTNCGNTAGWTRVAYVNMSQQGGTCPQGLTRNLSLCGRSLYSDKCQSALFPAFGISYSHVCGQLRGYQLGSPDAFRRYIESNTTINGTYVDGASITYGSAPHKHIWTYANGLVSNKTTKFSCPCNTNNTNRVPSYVGNDYYCESGTTQYKLATTRTFFPNDPLWDGQQCDGLEAPCCTHPNMPWFLKTLNETTIEDIELRVCGDEKQNEQTLLQVIELFVQ